MTMRWVVLASLLAAGPARALEISLEENKADRGSIGYVDLQKVFHRFPETARAKESYGETVRRAEEQVNLKRAELQLLRQEIARLKEERERTALAPAEPAPPVEPKGTPVPGAPALPSNGGEDNPPMEEGADAVNPPAGSTRTYTNLPGMGPRPQEELPAIPSALPEESTPTAKAEPLIINIPGVTDVPIVVPPPGGEAPAEPPPAAPESAPEPEAAAAAEAPPPASARPDRLAELDALIAAKEAELAGKETEFRRFQAEMEKGLLSAESRRTDVLLGKIYEVVQDVARESGVSVVVDKSQILFGQRTVDLTDQVIKKLEELSL